MADSSESIFDDLPAVLLGKKTAEELRKRIEKQRNDLFLLIADLRAEDKNWF